MTQYLGRGAWTTTVARGSTLTGTKLRGVAVHWPGTTQDEIGPSTQAAIASRLRSYRDYHVNTRGWSDIGYNLAIDQAGRVWMLRSTTWGGNRVGAHCASPSNPDANHEYVGVLLILGDQEAPSPAMVDAFQHWYANHFRRTWPGRSDVRGHGQVAGASTSCPGVLARAMISSMIQPPEDEDDMPTAKEIVDELMSRRVSKIDTTSENKTMSLETFFRYVHYYALGSYTATTKTLGSTTTTPRQAWQRAELRTLAILEAIKDLPGVDAEALAAELNRIDAQAIADAVVDEQAERLTD